MHSSLMTTADFSYLKKKLKKAQKVKPAYHLASDLTRFRPAGNSSIVFSLQKMRKLKVFF